MKKILVGLLLLLPVLCRADYKNFQHYRIVPNTTSIRNDMYFRGDIHITSDTANVNLLNCESKLILSASGTVKLNNFEAESGTITIKCDGTNVDFGISPSSMTVYVPVYMSYPYGTEAELKLISPARAYMPYVDTTNYQLVLSSGTGLGAFGATTNYMTSPPNW